MEIIYEHKPPFRLAGISTEISDNTDFAGLWESLFNQYSMEVLRNLGSGESFGSCYRREYGDNMRYLAGYDVNDLEQAEQLGLEVIDIPAAYYAVVTIHGPIAKSIPAGWAFIEEELDHKQLKHSGMPDFEVYTEGDMQAADFVMQLWVPVKEI